MNISLCITTYNRMDLLLNSFCLVADDPRVNEIVIVDDASTNHSSGYVLGLQDRYKPKVKAFINDKNIDCYRNKREAISKASNEWVIIFDSDNVMTTQYIDRIENLWIAGLNDKTIYQPSFAKPNFNFQNYEGLLVNKFNVAKYATDGMFCTMLNAMNYFVNRDEYLKVWDGKVDPVTSDSIYQNYNWLSAGNSIYVVPGLEYEHRVHEGSHYRNNVRRTPRGFHDEMINKLKAMQ